MIYNPDIHHRRSIRLKNYDYSQEGAYFITLCTQGRACLFGQVVNDAMILNAAGEMVQQIWKELPLFYPAVNVDTWVIMPNHLHGIIFVGAGPRACPDNQSNDAGQPRGVAPTDSSSTEHPQKRQPRGCAPTDSSSTEHPQKRQPRGVAPTDSSSTEHPQKRQPRGVAPTDKMSLSDVLHRFKSLTTRRYIDGVNQGVFAAFRGRLWQRNYYEHIIRNDNSLNAIRQYIIDNPINWTQDSEYAAD
jgi:REP element-mobilizing transposase RayT